MVKHTIHIPQLGEGLTTVRVVDLYKQAGESVNKDEALYGIETDKATVDIESPYSGQLVGWLVDVGAVIGVGDPMAHILTEQQEAVDQTEHKPQHEKTSDVRCKTKETKPLPRRTSTGIFIPPRIRAYCRQQGISADDIMEIPTDGDRLTLEMIDLYLKDKRHHEQAKPNTIIKDHTDQPLSTQQRWLNTQFKRSQVQVIPATLVSCFSLASFRAANEQLLQTAPSLSYISEFQLFAYWVSRVLAAFPNFRSRLENDNQRREYQAVNLGIAVQTEEGELVTAAMEKADTFEFAAFIEEFKIKIQEALQGHDQATDSLSVILTQTGGRTILFGTPLLVSPAVATLFFAIPNDERRNSESQVYLSLTFDHRLINGIEAAAFLDAIAKKLTEAIPRKNGHVIKQAESFDISSLTPETLKAVLIDKLADLLAMRVDEIDEQQSLGLLGLDSIKALALKDYLEQRLSTTLPATLLWHYPNVQKLLDYCLSIQKTLVPAVFNTQQTEFTDIEQLISEMETLSESEQILLLNNLP